MYKRQRDYLAAADFAKTLPYVDGDRMAAVGASYGGYSVFMLAGAVSYTHLDVYKRQNLYRLGICTNYQQS